MLAEQGRSLPGYVVREFEDFLKCGRLEHGFLLLISQDAWRGWLRSFGLTCSCEFSSFEGLDKRWGGGV